MTINYQYIFWKISCQFVDWLFSAKDKKNSVKFTREDNIFENGTHLTSLKGRNQNWAMFFIRQRIYKGTVSILKGWGTSASNAYTEADRYFDEYFHTVYWGRSHPTVFIYTITEEYIKRKTFSQGLHFFFFLMILLIMKN